MCKQLKSSDLYINRELQVFPLKLMENEQNLSTMVIKKSFNNLGPTT